MHTALLVSTAGVLVMAGLAGSVIRWHDRTASERSATSFSTPRPALRTLAPVEKAPHDQFERQLAHLTGGNVVLDMRALESLDAAAMMVEHWRNSHPVEAHLVCWLAAADDQDLVTAVRSLSEMGCSVLRVALVELTTATD